MMDAQALPPAGQAGELELAAQVAQGSETAFELLMRRHNRRLYRLARSMLRNTEDAQDALQEAYLLAYRSIANFRGECSLATWLSRVVANECLGRLRRQSRRDTIVRMVSADEDDTAQEPAAMASNDFDGPDAAFARAQLRRMIESKLDELAQPYRTVFVLRSVEELSTEETALCLNIPEATVRTRHFRARSLLREALARDLDFAERDVFAFDGARCDRIVGRVLARVRAGH